MSDWTFFIKRDDAWWYCFDFDDMARSVRFGVYGRSFLKDKEMWQNISQLN